MSYENEAFLLRGHVIAMRLRNLFALLSGAAAGAQPHHLLVVPSSVFMSLTFVGETLSDNPAR